ncbi:hypothetical protein V8C26DRAFT_249303 [Trichoderma gracile]
MQQQRASNWLAGHGALPDADSITVAEDGFGSPSMVWSLHRECTRIYGPRGPSGTDSRPTADASISLGFPGIVAINAPLIIAPRVSVCI